MENSCVAVVSGGLDSTTLVYDLLTQGHRPHLLSFNYGQRHSKELSYAGMTAERLDLDYYEVNLTSITELISNSALTSHEHGNGHIGFEEIEVPEGHYAEENMKQTIVPNRNMIMASIAIGLAVSRGYEFVATGVHAGDHWVYPDCRPEFIELLRQVALTANEGLHKFHPNLGPVYAPYLHKTKADIAYRALQLNVPLHLTWSCYKGGETHCGRCGTCVERLEAIGEAQMRIAVERGTGDWTAEHPIDETTYEDNEFWRTATK